MMIPGGNMAFVGELLHWFTAGVGLTLGYLATTGVIALLRR